MQIGGANSHFQQTITKEIERLIESIDAAPVPAAEKQDAKAKLAAFLVTSVANSSIGFGVKMLLHKCGLSE